MPPDLPESYYLDNVLTLFGEVSALYDDLLDVSEKKFLSTFYRLDEDAQKLCIRLLNRSHTIFRRSKLDYAEIGSIDEAARRLQQVELISINPRFDDLQLLGLFSKPEVLARLTLPREFAQMRRDEFDQRLPEAAEDGWQKQLRENESFYQVNFQEEYQRLQMLFFGNLNQSMTDFVLRDLGLFQYEHYRIDQGYRPYQSRVDIEQHWLLYELEDLLPSIDANDEKQLLACFKAIPGNIRVDSPAWGKSERLKNTIARQLERCGALDIALHCFESCQQPPARERRARILAQNGEPQAAIDICAEIAENPLVEEEFQFALSFAPRIAKKHELNLAAALQPTGKPDTPVTRDVVLEQQKSVELAAAEFLSKSGLAVYVENNLFNGVLGLLLWDVIFAEVPGAFYNPFQYRPADFYQPNFLERRRQQNTELWASVHDNSDIWFQVEKRWHEKQGIANPLVNWPALSIELIELALQEIDFAHWRAIFKRIMRDFRNNRSGFPDLVYFPNSGGYSLIEVKGPGDKLQKNQQRWMQYFSKHQIPHQVLNVEWQQP